MTGVQACGMERWATFDCYGTLVDWNGGIATSWSGSSASSTAAASRAVPRDRAGDPGGDARGLLSRGAHDRPRAARRGDRAHAAGGRGERSRALASDVARLRRRARGLTHAHERGWKLGILSNTDRDLVDASMDSIGVHFDLAIVAGEIDSYKPAHRHWEVFRERVGGADSIRHVHVAQSLYHDIAPARARDPHDLDQPARRAGRPAAVEDARSPRLADALDELVPAAELAAGALPDCRTFTAVAVGSGYECHRCGTTFAAGLVRVPRAWGPGARGWPPARGSRSRTRKRPSWSGPRSTSRPRRSPRRYRPPIVWAVVAAPTSARRRVAGRSTGSPVVWIDSHGDLNTPETSRPGTSGGCRSDASRRRRRRARGRGARRRA